MKSKPSVFVDTNLIAYAESINSPYFIKARKFIEDIAVEKELCVAPQVLMELYATLTNPKKTNPAVSSHEAKRRIFGLVESGIYRLIFPSVKSLMTVAVLLEKYPVRGAEIHDVNLAATMIDNGIDTIYTVDTKIFKKLGLKVIDPLT